MQRDEIKQRITELLQKMNIPVGKIEVAEEDGRERYSVETADSHLLIGSKGAHLFALNHIVKRMVNKGGGEERQFQIDVNNYQRAAVLNLKNLAKIMGERARSFKTNMELDPMSSFERMVIHSFLEEATDLKTESVGEGEKRRVVIKYVGE
ncbi:MAG: spoIIIJ-associated protein [Parcubacteria group bacterium Greene0416_79]|nr:MAG: spoIIIJ-associated protein [Parcubacteria group bacterium Greene0416_79]